MDRDDARRIAENEAIFRDINEVLEQGRWPAERHRSAFRCECARLGCNQMIEVSPADYEQIRMNPRRFLVAPGHEIEGAEVVVQAHDGYIVVEKIGAAGEVAELTDPRP